MEAVFYPKLLWIWSLLALVAAVALFYIPAPYGKHARRGWGPSIDSTSAWVVMESAAVLIMPALFILSGQRDPMSWVWLLLWEIHYLHRTFVFPLRRPRGQHRTPLSVVSMGFVFNLINGYVNGRYLYGLGPEVQVSWLRSPWFLVGLTLFVGGMALNIDSDNRLLRLSKRTQDYSIPTGGAFRWVSCPNYLGEIIEWIGWAVLTCSPGGLVFALWTAANLVPRAWTNHNWYREKFDDYPPARRALVPFVW